MLGDEMWAAFEVDGARHVRVADDDDDPIAFVQRHAASLRARRAVMTEGDYERFAAAALVYTGPSMYGRRLMTAVGIVDVVPLCAADWL